MRCTAQFFLGACYSAPDGTDLERFDSLAAVKRALWRRSDSDPYSPQVDDASVLVYVGHVTDVTDQRPAYEFHVGARGGIAGGAL